ncbi:MAG: hypothetical protein FH749_00950 [Firmicutes bacterium]|nr:hypothetical protein [Bacillota bacterium]
MQNAFAIFVLLLAVGFIWVFGGAMARAREWPDLVVTIILASISLAYALVYIWNLEPIFPSQVIGDLIMPLIEVVYGDWL